MLNLILILFHNQRRYFGNPSKFIGSTYRPPLEPALKPQPKPKSKPVLVPSPASPVQQKPFFDPDAAVVIVNPKKRPKSKSKFKTTDALAVKDYEGDDQYGSANSYDGPDYNLSSLSAKETFMMSDFLSSKIFGRSAQLSFLGGLRKWALSLSSTCFRLERPNLFVTHFVIDITPQIQIETEEKGVCNDNQFANRINVLISQKLTDEVYSRKKRIQLAIDTCQIHENKHLRFIKPPQKYKLALLNHDNFDSLSFLVSAKAKINLDDCFFNDTASSVRITFKFFQRTFSSEQINMANVAIFTSEGNKIWRGNVYHLGQKRNVELVPESSFFSFFSPYFLYPDSDKERFKLLFRNYVRPRLLIPLEDERDEESGRKATLQFLQLTQLDDRAIESNDDYDIDEEEFNEGLISRKSNKDNEKLDEKTAAIVTKLKAQILEKITGKHAVVDTDKLIENASAASFPPPQGVDFSVLASRSAKYNAEAFLASKEEVKKELAATLIIPKLLDKLEPKPNKLEPKPNKLEPKPNKLEPKLNKLEVKFNKLEVKPNKLEVKPNKLEVKSQRTGSGSVSATSQQKTDAKFLISINALLNKNNMLFVKYLFSCLTKTQSKLNLSTYYFPVYVKDSLKIMRVLLAKKKRVLGLIRFAILPTELQLKIKDKFLININKLLKKKHELLVKRTLFDLIDIVLKGYQENFYLDVYYSYVVDYPELLEENIYIVLRARLLS